MSCGLVRGSIFVLNGQGRWVRERNVDDATLGRLDRCCQVACILEYASDLKIRKIQLEAIEPDRVPRIIQ